MSIVNYTNRSPDYLDLDLNFVRKPGSKDITKVVGQKAVERSIRNLIATNYGDRLFRPWIGSNIRALLFENQTELTAINLSQAIREVIQLYEPRASVIAVDVTSAVNFDAMADENTIIAKITYRIKNVPEPFVTEVFLERIR